MSDYYNKNAQKYFDDTVNVNVSDLYKPFLEKLDENAHILDAGCGSGRDSLFFLKKGFEVTSMDASLEIAKLASAYIGKPVSVKRFQDIDWVSEFDAVWACATLLHVPESEIVLVFKNLAKSLKPSGIINGSFKYGNGERLTSEGRLFLDMNENNFNNIVENITELEIVKMWTTFDVRPGRENERWFNFIVKKV